MTSVESSTSSFYVTLPSNSSEKYFPGNQTGEYRTKLAHPVTLHRKWECALAEISYPRTWHTLKEDSHIGYMVEQEDDDLNEVQRIDVPKGYYRTVQDLINEIRARVPEAHRYIFKMTVDIKTQRVFVDVEKGCILLFYDNEIARLLGMVENGNWVLGNVMFGGKTYTTEPVSMDMKLHSLYVYTDVISTSLVGDACVPLLRIVPVIGEHGQMVTVTYDKPHYVPLRTNTFECIEINIANEKGDIVHFEYGNAIVKLHIRPCRRL